MTGTLFGNVEGAAGRVEIHPTHPEYRRLAAALRPSQEVLDAIRAEEERQARAQLLLPFMLTD